MRLPRALILTLFVTLAPAAQASPGSVPTPGNTWLGNAQLLEKRGDWLSLLALGNRWTQSEGDNPLAWFVVGRAYSAMGRYAEAVAAYQENLRLDPRDSYAHNNLGNSYLALGQNRPALEAYRRAVRSDPDYLLAWRNLGQAYYNLKGPSGMVQDMNRLQAVDPELAQAWRRLATLYTLKRDNRVVQSGLDVLRNLGSARRERLFELLLVGI